MELKKQLTVIQTITVAELRSRYRNTFAGILWVMLNPLVLFSVHGLIFKFVLKINVENFYIFLVSGLLPWIFMSNLILQGNNIFMAKRDSLLSFQIHPLSLTISKTIETFINFIIPFVFLIVVLFYDRSFNVVGFMFIPLLMLQMVIGMFFVLSSLAILQVFFRDIQFILQFVINIMLFLTPIFYPRHLIPDKYQIFVDLNPFYAYIRGFKAAIWEFNLQEIYISLAYSSCFTIVSFIACVLLWKRFRNELYLTI